MEIPLERVCLFACPLRETASVLTGRTKPNYLRTRSTILFFEIHARHGEYRMPRRLPPEACKITVPTIRFNASASAHGAGPVR